MPEAIIRPSLPKVMVRRQGVFTAPVELAALECRCPRALGPCGGIDIERIPLAFRQFQLLVQERGKRFIKQQGIRGYEWNGGPIELHGPWPSLDMANKMVDLSSTRDFGRREEDGFEHPEKAASIILTPTANLDYILVGLFLFQDRMTDLEVP